MKFEVRFELKAQEELDKLPSEIIDRVISKLQRAEENPAHYIEKLTGMPEFKIRVGDYRIVLLFDKTNKRMKIQAIGHRKNIYKRYKTS